MRHLFYQNVLVDLYTVLDVFELRNAPIQHPAFHCPHEVSI